RTWMRQQDVEAIHVSRHDMFQGEYVAACDERLAWVSGFTGSAGFAIITLTAAHLFVDGRYTLQAEIQAKDFTIHSLIPREIDEVCSGLQTLHYDPWLVSMQQILSWQERLEMVPLHFNPIDFLWQDRPPAEINLAYDYSVVYAGVEREQKLVNLRQTMQRSGIKVWLISNPESVCWLLNLRGQDLPYVPVVHCMAMVTVNEVVLFCEPAKISQSLQQTIGVKVVSFSNILSVLKAENCIITACRASTPSALLESDLSFEWNVDVCEINRAKKNISEQKGMQNCHKRDAVALLRFWQWFEKQNSITEIDAQDYLGTCRSAIEMYQGDSFATISGYGAHGAIVHYRATKETNIRIGEGLYLLDSGGQYLDGTTDITRVFCKGVPTKEQRTHYTLVLKGHIALANVRFPVGTTGAQLDVLARQYLWGQGLDYAHGTGHGVGSFLNVHEGPQGISKANRAPLEPGMVVSNEPGLYITGQYGIRIENLQMVQNSAFDGFLEFVPLTMVPYEAKLIDWSMLNAAELAWLQQYYQMIQEHVAPLLDADEKIWLEKKLI
ncbi:MAG: aminopeptidase P family protein, partial [Proteobacteria bacterium]|nr:aminopeptidase P family protein [Pseudomonadota bacterium]